jgi:peptidoglycan/LPS O-acetylase OafA/YrhL
LDALRAIAVLLVIGRHLWIPPPDSRLLANFAAAWQRGGWIGVDVFFVLSGFLISGLLFREHREHGRISVRRFLARRGLKIYPAFYVLIGVTILFPLLPESSLTPPRVWAEVLFVQNYLPGMWNHTWSLAVEEHFYLLLPFLLLLLLGRSSRKDDPFAALPTICAVLAVAVLVLRVANSLSRGYQHQTLFLTHFRIDSLMFGVLLSYWYHYHTVQVRNTVLQHRTLFTVLGLALLAPAFLFPLERNMAFYTVGFSGFALGSGLLLMAALHSPVGLQTAMSPLAKIGAYSYSIYLWHMPVLYSLLPKIRQRVGEELTYVPTVVIAVGLCLLLGSGISQLIEYPVLRLRDRWFPSRSEPLPGAELRQQGLGGQESAERSRVAS